MAKKKKTKRKAETADDAPARECASMTASFPSASSATPSPNPTGASRSASPLLTSPAAPSHRRHPSDDASHSTETTAMACDRIPIDEHGDLVLQVGSELDKEKELACGWIPIDEDGDLVLRVGSELDKEKEFKVCSAALRRASPVLKGMLFGPWKEAKPPDGCSEWVVELPEDDPSPLTVLLDIIHGRFHLVPTDVPLAQLYDILILTDKYDMIHVIRPWAGKWAVAVRNFDSGELTDTINHDTIIGITGAPTGQGRIRRLHAAWELGLKALVIRDITQLIFSCRLSTPESGAEVKVYYAYETEPLALQSGHFGPPDVLDIVLEHRRWAIQSVLDFYHEEVKRRIKSNPSACQVVPYHATNKDRKQCDTLLLGGIWQYLDEKPIPKTAGEVTENADDLIDSLLSMFFNLPILNHHHVNCSPTAKYRELKKNVRVLDTRWDSLLQPHHTQRMEEQRKKTGLLNY